MKKYIHLIWLLILGVTACENQENVFDDYGTTACWFPYQSPARTLILGNYDVGFNENDNAFIFEIGAKLSGVYENTQNRYYYYEIDESLLDTVNNVVALPSEYYSIETPNPVTIPAGKMDGRIIVQLKDEFFDDPLSYYPKKDSINYVIPVVITEIDGIDSLLTGVVADGLIVTPHRLVREDWQTAPKDYTLFGIKYINKYHGVYFKRGSDKLETDINVPVHDTTSVYRAEYVEYDLLRDVIISGRDKVIIEDNIIRRGGKASPGTVAIELAFDENENCTVTSADGAYNVVGTGKFVEGGDEWGGKKRDAIYVNYTYDDLANNEKHTVIDTFVVRNRGVVFEQFPIELKE